MQPDELLLILHTAEKLKDTTRHCCTSGGRRESVAEHSWRLALMAFFLRDEFPRADMDKVLRMCLIHDLGECFTGDIPSFSKTPADEVREERLLHAWVDALPAPYAAEMRTLYREMAALETEEAKIYKALDKLEAVIQHNESDLSTWAENEYSLNLTYASPPSARPSAGRRRRKSTGKRKSSKETNACIPMKFSCAGPLRFPNPPWPTATSPSARCW